MEPTSRQNMQPLDPAQLNIVCKELYQPSLADVVTNLAINLCQYFAMVEAEIVECPDFRQHPFNFSVEGLCGNPIILDVGGPSYLLPTAQKNKFYDVRSLLNHLNYNPDCFVIGAGAGPWPRTNCNCELIMRTHLLPDQKVENFTQYAFVDKSDSRCILQQLPKDKNDTTFSLLGNMYVCEGKPGRLIKLVAKRRITNLDFASSIQKILSEVYANELVGLGGMFMVKNGRVRQHVMRDFSRTPLTNKTQLNNWLRFYSMKTPLTAVGTIVSAETDLDLRVQHFHAFSRKDKLAGHYHIDTTPVTIEYEAYFSVATKLYRIDQPATKLDYGKD